MHRQGRLAPPLLAGVPFRQFSNGGQAMESDIRLLRAMAGQFLMGAIMGALFVGVIIFANVEIVAAIIDSSAFPLATMIVIFAGPMLYFAFGAGITGILFLVSD